MDRQHINQRRGSAKDPDVIFMIRLKLKIHDSESYEVYKSADKQGAQLL
ncbi:hypothetical protein KGM_209295 [Danaus plexippus plexippus]|uniref:Uncharacterized protein n=1 Tax=Danaus plexippus plexippus TaxID=278856 RepID=A0A212F2N9_DANPL|nr:hypothetical protein KGM_209295 [Danaus plexippus plexippus]